MTAVTASASDHAPGGPDDALDLAARVRLAHAAIARHLDHAGVRSLHVKGYATAPGVYRADRPSTDVDLLVAPDQAARACEVLADHGWGLVADFSEGSVFEHAATLWHDHLGYVDVHRLFPGLGSTPEEAFEALWAEHGQTVVAGRPVAVPSLDHQRLVVVVHAARDAGRGRTDVEHLRAELGEREWAALRARAEALGAGAAWRVATQEATDDADEHDLRLFTALRASESGMDLFATRWAAARSGRERVRLVLHTIPVNRPHLQMRLGRTPTRADRRREQAARARALMVWAWHRKVRRGR